MAAVMLDCGCWISLTGCSLQDDRPRGDCLRHGDQAVITRPDLLEPLIEELRMPTGSVPKEAAWM